MQTYDVVIHLHVKADNPSEALLRAMEVVEEAELDVTRFPECTIDPRVQLLDNDPTVF